MTSRRALVRWFGVGGEGGPAVPQLHPRRPVLVWGRGRALFRRCIRSSATAMAGDLGDDEEEDGEEAPWWHGAALDPGGRWVATFAPPSRALRLWDLEAEDDDGRALAPPGGAPERRPVTCLAWHGSSRLVATGHPGGIVGLWDPVSGARVRELRLAADQPSRDVLSIAADAGGRLVCGTDSGAMHVWAVRPEPAAGEGAAGAAATELHRLRHSRFYPVRFLASSGERFVSCSDSDADFLRVWSWETGQLLHAIDHANMGARVTAVVWRGSTLIASLASACEKRGALRVWDTAYARPARWDRTELRFPQVPIAVQLADAGCTAVILDGDRVHLWTLEPLAHRRARRRPLLAAV